jgi:2-polyprenyl-3-methyl-5-hydroxy-6-metoxy-1,4-benzoquinol methylase
VPPRHGSVKSPRAPAARRALGLFATAPRGDRVHVQVRWWSAPLAEVEAATPRQGRILEIGCGHGLLSLYLALSSGDRRVVGVDIDGDKIALARQAAGRLAEGEAHVSFVAVEPGELPAGPFDAVVVCDVLYLLGPRARATLIDDAVDHLAPDGVLLLKETARTPRWKDVLNVIQERLATKVLRITEGTTVDFADPTRFVEQLRGRGLEADVRRIDKGYLHPHVLVTARRAAVPAEGSS